MTRLPRALSALFAAALCLGSVIVPASALAVTQTINFDDFTAPALFNETTPLTTRYQAQGITFAGPAADQGGAILDKGSSGYDVTGYSAPNLFAFQNDSGSYALGPERISFASPATSVSIKVGYASANTVSLTAFDGATPLATATTTAQTALTPLTVLAPRITSVRLAYTGNALIADDLQAEIPPAPAPPANTGAGANPGPPTVDKTKPAFSSLTFSSPTFRAATSGASTSAKDKKKSRAKVGTKVSFNLSEPSSVKFTVERKTTGRKVAGKCKVKKRSNAEKKRCTRYVRVTGSFTIASKAGKNTFTFRGRIAGKSLKPGSYLLNSTATDRAKNKSTPKRKGFKIVK